MKKKKTITLHAKTIDRMNRETNRAVSQVLFLEKLYSEMMQARKKENK